MQAQLLHWRHMLDQLQREVAEGGVPLPVGRARRLAALALEVQYRLGELCVELGDEIERYRDGPEPSLGELVPMLQAHTIARLSLGPGAELAQALQRLAAVRAEAAG